MNRRRYRASFIITAMVLLGIVVTLPLSLVGVVDLLGPRLLVLLIAAAAAYSVLLRVAR